MSDVLLAALPLAELQHAMRQHSEECRMAGLNEARRRMANVASGELNAAQTATHQGAA